VPNRHLTPGAITPTLENGKPCIPGRRPQSDRSGVTSTEKAQIAAELYHVKIVPRMEFDHLVPFSLCGSNGPANLWPEPYDGAAKAYNVLNHKDELEAKVSTMFHAGQIDAAHAQAVFLNGSWPHEWCLLVHKPGVDCHGV
jgi:hypothetical protein